MLVREEPFLFKPGDFYALVAALGAGVERAQVELVAVPRPRDLYRVAV